MKLSVFLFIMTAFLITGLCVLRQPVHNVATDTEPVGSVSSYTQSAHPVYRYSVIPGGAYSAAELQADIEQDPVVRRAYDGFNGRYTTLVRLSHDKMQYVQYRIKDAIFVTSRPVRIPAGEILMTDGQHFARTRCGNRLFAALPPGAIAAQLPAEIDLDTPEPDRKNGEGSWSEIKEFPSLFPIQDLPGAPKPETQRGGHATGLVPPCTTNIWSVPPSIGAGGDGGILVAGVLPPPATTPSVASTPEPSTFGLGLITIIVLGVFISKATEIHLN